MELGEVPSHRVHGRIAGERRVVAVLVPRPRPRAVAFICRATAARVILQRVTLMDVMHARGMASQTQDGLVEAGPWVQQQSVRK